MNNRTRYVIVVAILTIALSLGVFVGILIKDNVEKENAKGKISTDKVIETPKPNIDNTQNDETEVENMKLKLTINDSILYATLTNNSTTKALVEKLKEGEIVVNMSDYAGMEKVGDIGFTLPQNNEMMSTDTGDIILYQGNQLAIYYGQNEYSLTSVAKIPDITREELLNIMGDVDFELRLSLEEK